MPQLRTAIQAGEVVGIPAPEERDWLIRESDLLRLPGGPRTIAAVPPRANPARLILRLVVLFAIVASIAGVASLWIGGATCAGMRPHATEAVLKQVSGQLEMFRLAHGRYPARLEDLVSRPEYVPPDSWPSGGYLTDPPQDGWGREFVYRAPGSDGRRYDLFSLGEDARESEDDLWNPMRPGK